MASLIRPLNRCLMASKQLSNRAVLANVILAKRFKTTESKDSLNKPIKKEPAQEGVDPKESFMADPWDVLYGTERFEVAMKNKGYDDPYDMDPKERKAVSSVKDPNIVSTLMDKRIVACICENDTHHINFMQISLGETKRCECGHWFKCVERELPDLSEYDLHISKDAHH